MRASLVQFAVRAAAPARRVVRTAAKPAVKASIPRAAPRVAGSGAGAGATSSTGTGAGTTSSAGAGAGATVKAKPPPSATSPSFNAAEEAASIRSVPELPRKDPSGVEPQLSLDESMVSNLTDLETDEVSATVAETPETFGDDWGSSFQGLGSAPFPKEAADILLAPVNDADVEITPDGLIYLPEIKYRRILNRAFGPGGWGIAPRTKTLVTKRKVTREYGLVCLGRLVSVSRGEMDYFNSEGVTTAMEGCKSNALMRCCKDLGIASELWDPAFIRTFKSKHCDTKYFEKKKRFAWKRKDRPWEYPYV